MAALEKHAALQAMQEQFDNEFGFGIPKGLPRYPIRMPPVLSLETNQNDTIGILNKIRQLIFVDRVPVFLYFNDVEVVDPAALLLLSAEIYRCRNLRRYRIGPMLHGNYPRSKTVAALLGRMGFFRLLEVQDRPGLVAEQQDDQPSFVRFSTGNRVEAKLVAEVCDAVEQKAFAMSPVAKGRLVGAVKEAMANVVEHGYRPGAPLPVMGQRWWVGGYVDPSAREMMLLIVDQGVGIPATLEPELFDNMNALLGAGRWAPTDGRMIQIATQLHRSTTGQAFRGKGFRDMKSFIDTCDDGELWVLSNRGSYRYMKQTETVGDEGPSIGGTLIQWRIRNAALVEVE